MNSVSGRELSFHEMLKIFRRRRLVAIVVALTIFSLSVFACVFMTRRYEATSTIQLQKSSSASLGLESLMSGAAGDASDALSINIDLQTQASILKSKTLALKVIEDLTLQRNKDFQPRFNPINWVISLISPRGPADQEGATLENSPYRRETLLKIFAKHLVVEVDSGTRLIDVSYSNRDPKVAAEIVNHLVQALIDYSFQTKFKATNEVSQWLEGQLSDLRAQSEDLQAKVVQMQESTGLFGVGGTDLQGKPVVYSPILDRLQQATAVLSQAELNRVIKGAIYQITKTGNPELISQLSGTSFAGQSSTGVTNSLALLQSLQQQEAAQTAQVDQDASQFGDAYPKLIQERAALRATQQQIQLEIVRIGGRAKNDYEIANKTLAGAQREYNSDKRAAEQLNDKTIEYTILAKEASDSQELYQDLLKRLKEAGILEGLHSSSITVIDVARPPARPNHPNVPLYLALGLALGIFGGGCSALVVDAIDNKIQTAEEIEEMGIPLLGLIPQVKVKEAAFEEIPLLDPSYSFFSEAMRRLRSNLLISRHGKPPQIILVTSGSPGEGKSMLSLNLAAALSQFDKKVLLLEMDLRRPVLRQRLKLKSKTGMSQILADREAIVKPATHSSLPNVYIIPAGPVPPYPVELLGSPRLPALLKEWQTQFDFIVMDSPPVLPVTDVQLLEGVADATILLARLGSTTRVSLRRAYQLILPHVKDPATPTVGVVLNFISRQSGAYYGYYGYYGNKKYEYGQSDRQNQDS